MCDRPVFLVFLMVFVVGVYNSNCKDNNDDIDNSNNNNNNNNINNNDSSNNSNNNEALVKWMKVDNINCNSSLVQ